MQVKKLPRLNVGCGRAIEPKDDGWLNCDLFPGDGVDFVFDACGRWPFDDESVLEVSSSHTLEHLSDPMAFFREAWRVLIPNGQLNLRVPYGWHQSSWWDLTHRRPWMQENFAILQPGYAHFTRNFQQRRMGFAFWIHNVILILDKPWARMWRFKPLQPLVRWAVRHLLNVVKELKVEAFKTTEEDPRSVSYGGEYHPSIVPCSWGVFEHEYYGRNGEGLEFHVLIVFTDAKKRTATAGY